MFSGMLIERKSIKFSYKEDVMLTFLLVLVLVFALVDLLVLLVIEPLATKEKIKKARQSAYQERVIPTMGFVGATMYDGGIKKEKDKDSSEKKSS